MERKQAQIWITLGLVGYLVFLSRKNGGTLAGNPEGYKVKIDGNLALDMIVPTLISNPMLAAAVKHGARKGLSGVADRFGIQLG